MIPLDGSTLRFKRNIIAAVSLLIAAVISISSWHVLLERKDVLTAAERQTEGYTRALAEHSESALAEADRVLRDLLHEINTVGGYERFSRAELYRMMSRQLEGAPQMGSLFLVDSTGEMLVNSHEFPSRPISVADREYYRYYHATPGADLTLSRPVLSRLVKRWRFNIMRPLNKPGDPFAGLLALGFEAEYFKRFFSPASLGPRGRIALIRTDGAPLVFEPYKVGAYEQNFRDTVLFREKLLSSPTGVYYAAPRHNLFDDTARIVAYQKLARFPVIASVSLDLDDVLAPWRKKAILTSSTTFGLCLVIILMTRLLFRHLDRLQSIQSMLREQQELVKVKAAQIDAANDAILLIDDKGRIVHFNNALVQMTGYRDDELQWRTLAEIEPPEYAAEVENTIAFILENGQATFESAYRTKSGAILPVEIHARIMTTDGGRHILSIVRDISERKRSEHREQTRLRILEEMATGATLADLLGHIVRFVEQEQEGALCSVLLADEEAGCLRHGAAPSLPDSYNQAVDGLKIGNRMGSCGTAAFRKGRVIVENIEGHPFWKGFNPVTDAGLKSCWSEPVLSPDGLLLGTFAIYHREPKAPEPAEIRLIESAAHLVSIAIERRRAETHKKTLEAQLHHVQKIDAIGQLAGGIAHDFNNLLTPILVYADMIQRKLSDDDPLTSKVQGITSAAVKARDLTKQLLSFGRKQMLNMQTLDLNEITLSFQDILKRTIRENIEIRVLPPSGQIIIRADRGQIEQILLNLAVNAQDAISGNGSITMETGRVVLDDEYSRLHPGIRPGPYALLTFQDSGCGMDDATLLHIFEPFFTTKQVGHGTGLGLATVYGIIKQHEGYITVLSAPDKGTSFNIFLPLSQDSVENPIDPQIPARDNKAIISAKSILMVEDNEMVRIMAVELLESSGYRVIAAELPTVALELAAQQEHAIDLLITDVVMPEMNGQELAGQLREMIPKLPVIYISGYTNDVFVHDGALEESVSFLQKPFTAEKFLEQVRQALARQGAT